LDRIVANGAGVAANVLGHDSSMGSFALGLPLRRNVSDRYVGLDIYIK
jgi:hypothetical protein